MSNIYTHKHHIIPRHLGGTNEPSNLVELTIEEHALAHKKLYDLYNRWQDKLAWLGLSGRIGKEEIIRMTCSEASKGKIITEETRRNMSKAQKGKNNPMYGKKFTEEHRRKLSEAHKGIPKSEEIKRNMSKAQKGKIGKKHTEESKRKISEASKGRKHTEITKRKMSEARKGIPLSEITKRNMSEAAKLRWNRERSFSKDA